RWEGLKMEIDLFSPANRDHPCGQPFLLNEHRQLQYKAGPKPPIDPGLELCDRPTRRLRPAERFEDRREKHRTPGQDAEVLLQGDERLGVLLLGDECVLDE